MVSRAIVEWQIGWLVHHKLLLLGGLDTSNLEPLGQLCLAQLLCPGYSFHDMCCPWSPLLFWSLLCDLCCLLFHLGHLLLHLLFPKIYFRLGLFLFSYFIPREAHLFHGFNHHFYPNKPPIFSSIYDLLSRFQLPTRYVYSSILSLQVRYPEKA